MSIVGRPRQQHQPRFLQSDRTHAEIDAEDEL
jgi:hypothetical protein